MEKCVFCGEKTVLIVNSVAICIECMERLDAEKKLPKRETGKPESGPHGKTFKAGSQ